MKKKQTILLMLLVIFATAFSATVADVFMLNGDKLPSNFLTEEISFVTDYGLFVFPVEYLFEIQFPEQGKGVTELWTIFGEHFQGFLMNERILIEVYDKKMEIISAKISKIAFDKEKIEAKDFDFFLYLRNGDAFIGYLKEEAVGISTSYGTTELKYQDMKKIRFEGVGNVLSKIEMRDGGMMQGIIQNEFLPLRFLSDVDLEIVPDMIDYILFMADIQKKTREPANNELWAIVQAGSFMMGNARNDREGSDNEMPTHKVKITYDYWMKKHEVTFDEYDAYCAATGKTKPNDKNWGRGKRPVILVSWADAMRYCNWLSEKEGLVPAYNLSSTLQDALGNQTTDLSRVEGYRLPTEAEWEYAAKGGHLFADTKYAGSDKIDDVGWYDKNSQQKTQEVGKKKPNALGIYDLTGNVAEWCQDWIDAYTMQNETNPISTKGGSKRITRGGSWYVMPSLCRNSSRNSEAPDNRFQYLGFRVVRTVVK